MTSRPLISSNNPDIIPAPRQKSLTSILTQMGFPMTKVLIAIEYTGTNSEDEIIDFLTKGEHGWNHPFLPKEGKTECEICEEGKDQHQEHVFAEKDRLVRSTSDIKLAFRRGDSAALPVAVNTCPICFEEIATAWRLKECSKHVFCDKCAREYIASKATEGLEMKCPGDRCDIMIPNEVIAESIGSERMSKYVRLFDKRRLMRDPDVKWCRTRDCEGYVRSSQCGPDNSVSCAVCDEKMCGVCGEKFHAGLTCEQAVDKELEAWSRNKAVKHCPSCRRLIEKIEGCDHMTCVSCRHEWCWQCLEPYTLDHFSPDSPNFCPILAVNYAENPPVPARNVHHNHFNCFTKGKCFGILTAIGLILAFPLMFIVMLIIVPFIFAYGVQRECVKKKSWKVFMAILAFLVCLFFDPLFTLMALIYLDVVLVKVALGQRALLNLTI